MVAMNSPRVRAHVLREIEPFTQEVWQHILPYSLIISRRRILIRIHFRVEVTVQLSQQLQLLVIYYCMVIPILVFGTNTSQYL